MNTFEEKMSQAKKYYKENVTACRSYFTNNLQRDIERNKQVIKYFCKSFGYGFFSIGLTCEEIQSILSGSYSQCYVSNAIRLNLPVDVDNSQWIEWIKEGFREQ